MRSSFLGLENQRRALWAAGPVLGSLDLDTGQDRIVVTLPRHENVACAAWSEDGSLLATASQQSSLALWSADGALLADWPGNARLQSDCGEHSFALAPASRRAAVTLEYQSTRLFGAGLSTTLRSTDPKMYVQSKFSPDGRRLFASIEHERVAIHDAFTGKALGHVSGRGAPEFSFTGKYFRLLHATGETRIYDTASLQLLSTEELKRSDDVELTYLLDPEGKRAYSDVGPWRVGSTEGGYAVFDTRTGAVQASWRASGYGCGYEWAWRQGTLVFIEGPLLTFWSKSLGTKTQASDCGGAMFPIFTKDSSRVVALDGIWSTTTHQLLAKLEMPTDADVWGLSRDERHVLGRVTLKRSPDAPVTVGWDTATGKVVWQRQPLAVEPLSAWPFVDPSDGKHYWLGHLLDRQHGVQQLVFDDQCWAGPAQLPQDSGLPAGPASQRCPELLAAFKTMMHARGFAAPVYN